MVEMWKSELEGILAELREVKVQKAELDAKEKELKARAQELLEEHGLEKFYSDEHGGVYFTERHSVTIDKRLLKKKWPEIYEAVKKERVSRYITYVTPEELARRKKFAG